MSVISIAELKARFVTGDRPTQKDWDDLIDTLVASAGVATPSGPASGDLSGTYPGPAVAANAITLAKMAQLTNPGGGALLGRSAPGTGNVEQIGIGSGLLISGGTLSYTGGGGGGGGSADPVLGAISLYTADAIPFDDAILPITSAQAPATFGTELPQHVRVVAVCHTARANYQPGDEVPIEYFRNVTTPSHQCVTFAMFVSGGQVTCQIKCEYGAIGTGVGEGIAVYDRDSLLGDVPTLVPFFTGEEPEDFFHLKVYMSRLEHGTGYGSIALFEPADQTIPAAAGDLATFTHGFGALPMHDPMVALVCAVADGTTGHAAGDTVPISTAFETAFTNPAFGVTTNSSDILVRREATTIQIPHKNTGALANLTVANWRIRVRATRGVDLPTLAFPALTYMVSNPMGAWSYDNMMYVIHYDDDAASSFLCRIDMKTGQVTRISSISPASYFCNLSMFRLVDGGTPVDCIFMCDRLGIHRIRMDTLVKTQIWPTAGTTDQRHYKVMDVYTGGLGSFAHPDMLIAYSAYGASSTVNDMAPQKITWTGVTYTTSSILDQVNWSDLTGSSGAAKTDYIAMDVGSHPILHFQYNPIRRRIYLVHAGSGYMNVLTLLPGPTSLYDWWVGGSPVDGTKIEYTKILALAGGGDTWTDTDSEKMFVEFDGLTGAERALVLVRRGNTALTGSVCRIPWTE